MVIPVKVQCGCGQKYAFEVEPVGGMLPAPVACPVCGADGTEAANQILALRLASQPGAGNSTGRSGPTPAAAALPLRVGAPAVNGSAAAALVIAPSTAARISLAAPAVAAPSVVRVAHTAAPAPAPAAAPAARIAPAAPAAAPVRRPGQMDRRQAEVEAKAKIMWGDSPQEVVKFLRVQGLEADEATQLVDELVLERAVAIRSNGFKKIFVGIGLICVPIVAAIVFLAIGVFPLKIFGLTLVVGCYGIWTVIKGTIMFVSPKSEPGDVSEQ